MILNKTTSYVAFIHNFLMIMCDQKYAHKHTLGKY